MQAQTKESQAQMTPESAVLELKSGNSRFVENKALSRNLLEQVRQTQ